MSIRECEVFARELQTIT